MTLGDRFNRDANGLNLMRLILAVSVILWHSFPLTGRGIAYVPLRQLISEVGVDGFFTISGFLIYSSWLNRPKLGPYFRARVLRIFPGFIVALIVTAFVIAPVGQLLQGAAVSTLFHGGQAFRYVAVNIFLWPFQFGISGTPLGVPYPHVWNGSTWTLPWEFFCYLAIPILFFSRVLGRRWALPVLFISLTIAAAIAEFARPDSWLINNSLRFSMTFTAGMLIHRYKASLSSSRLSIAAASLIVLACMFLPNYRILGAVFLAYLLVAISSYWTARSVRFENDVSYGMYIYAFPVQQVLAMSGLALLPPFFSRGRPWR